MGEKDTVQVQSSDLKAAEAARKEHDRQKLVKALRFIRDNKKLLIGGILLILIVLVAIFADKIALYDYAAIGTGGKFELPSAAHPFGTDHLQRDMFSRVVYGTRISLKVGIICVAISVCIGVPLGLIAGYAGGWPDLLLSRASDVLLSIPWVLMAIAVTAVLGPGVRVVYVAMGLVHAPGFLRLTRSMVLSLREREYVAAAQQMGQSKAAILFKDILPNCAGTIIIRATSSMAGAVLSEAAISYLGYGTQPPDPSWGLLLTDCQGFLWNAPYLAVFPGLAIVLLVLAINLLGDGLRDLLDPRYKGKVMN